MITHRIHSLMAVAAGTMQKKAGLTRRRFLLGLFNGVGLFAGGAWYIRFFEPYHPEISRISLPIADLPDDLNGFTITHITDIHHSDVISIEHIRKCVELTNGLKPDIIFLTGDYVTGSSGYIAPCINELSGLKSRYGVYAVPGNHDYWTDIDITASEFSKAGIRFIVDENLSLDIGRASLTIIGLDDLWAGLPNINNAMAGAKEEGKKILLMHNPDLFEELLPRGIDLILSGHTHGGQVNLPFIGPPITPSRFGAKYARGLIKKEKSQMYINRGLGLIHPAIRFRCRPEIAFFALTQ